MTSSLVGSEMCIRDREFGCPKKNKAKIITHHMLGKGVLVMSDQDSGTVSYTHLTLPTICSV
eukprot:9300739-Prorocentrum_lima.AAC.1